MLVHHSHPPAAPARVVVLGANGFIGRNLVRRLMRDGTPHLALGSSEIDLTQADAADRLVALLAPDDAVVMLAALTPDRGRDLATFLRNIDIARAVCLALERVPAAHVIYVSSDAVYPFGEGIVSEASAANPSDLYGTMHRTREVMVGASTKAPYAVLRPTLVYGGEDTHNSYGPNRFVRQALKEGKIVLGGGGEETRDHVFVDDVARVIDLVLRHRSAGVLNLATGRSLSFDAVARAIAGLFEAAPAVVYTPRTTPMTYRSFDVTAMLRAFPGVALTPLEAGLRPAYAALLAPSR